jgi:hypothetical protein
MGLIFAVQQARLRHGDLWSFHILFLSVPFVLKTSWPVDLVFISFAQALLAWKLLEGERAIPGSEAVWERPYKDDRHKHLALAHAFVSLFLLLTSIIISNIVFFNLFGDRFRYGFIGFIFWADLLLLVASYIELLPPALRLIRARPAVTAGSPGENPMMKALS